MWFSQDGSIPRSLLRGWMPPADIGAKPLSVIPRGLPRGGFILRAGSGEIARFGKAQLERERLMLSAVWALTWDHPRFLGFSSCCDKNWLGVGAGF